MQASCIRGEDESWHFLLGLDVAGFTAMMKQTPPAKLMFARKMRKPRDKVVAMWIRSHSNYCFWPDVTDSYPNYGEQYEKVMHIVVKCLEMKW